MDENQKLEQISQDYLQRIKQNLPSEKPPHIFIIGLIGLIASGKSTVAKLLVQKLPGTVLMKSNSARFLLNQAGLRYGDNVRKLTFDAAKWLIQNEYSVVFDGDHVELEKRENTQKLADELKAKFYLIRIRPYKDLSFQRLQKVWEEIESGKRQQNFEDFVVVTRGKEKNLFDRVPLHEDLKLSDIPQLIGQIDNSGSEEYLEKQIGVLVSNIVS